MCLYDLEEDYVIFSVMILQECFLYLLGKEVSERIIDHNGRDKKSHLFRHSVEHNHKNVERQDFKIIGKGYRNNAMKRKISEALYCRELKPTLNVQEKSIDLKLFN